MLNVMLRHLTLSLALCLIAPAATGLTLPDPAPLHPVALQAMGTGVEPQSHISLPLDLTPLPRDPDSLYLQHTLSQDVQQHFPLILLVQKNRQRMAVMQKTKSGYKRLHDWPISTGRNQAEYNKLGRRVVTATLPGLYQLDPARFYPRYHSTRWDSPMDHAMFFNGSYEGAKMGLAIHAAHGDEIKQLGRAASAGCVRLAPDKAKMLFDLVQKTTRGMVPRFAYDPSTGSTLRNGSFHRSTTGDLVFTQGYHVLVLIRDTDQIATQ